MKKINITKLIKAIVYRFPFTRKHLCFCCNHYLTSFLPYKKGSKGSSVLMKSLNVIGSDVDNFECPWCGSTDRERHLFLYLQETKLIEQIKGTSVLHFAPEARLQKLIESNQPKNYVKCDLYPTRDDIISEDMQNLSFPDQSFDFVIANHVLEHVNSVEHALKEIFRVLKPNAYAILQTPYSDMLIKTWSDKGIKSEQARLQAFGQEDHVRLFGKDIFSVFTQYGLTSKISYHNEILNNFDSIKYGVNSKEPFFLFQRQ